MLHTRKKKQIRLSRDGDTQLPGLTKPKSSTAVMLTFSIYRCKSTVVWLFTGIGFVG